MHVCGLHRTGDSQQHVLAYCYRGYRHAFLDCQRISPGALVHAQASSSVERFVQSGLSAVLKTGPSGIA